MAKGGIRQKRNREGRLIVVSNRVADPKRDRKAGGLAVAVGETLEATGGGWFGWSGEVAPDARHSKPIVRLIDGIYIVTIDLTSEELDGFYFGFSNQCLWPILHYRIDLVHFEQEYYDKYRIVNRRFANALAQFLGPNDVIWIHDLHLIPMAAELRQHGAKQPIGFFLHVPFPPPEVVAALPRHHDLFKDMMAYDLLGFQTQRDTACFRNYAMQELGAVMSRDGSLQFAGHRIQCGAYPAGIDVDSFTELSTNAAARKQIASLGESVGNRAMLVGVDRLDYSKGLVERLKAYREFLKTYKENRNKVVLMQVTPPSRETLESYVQIRRELDRLEGDINGEFGEMDWTPVRYIRRAVSRSKLAALYRASRVGLVTPLRDGMNLVAKEYIAAQDENDPGVLILSRFAGAAEAMEQALIVNPYDVEQVAYALQVALHMPLEERRERHRALLATIKKEDVHAWSRAFLTRLQRTKSGFAGTLPLDKKANRAARQTTQKPAQRSAGA
ncbi:MAG: trehalose-6-phosphate synthase [Betaproteobacteria bacterium]|nr:MAG: trehalose-6-phosphate synthase [Betaproteobacteria bacterium]